MRPAAFLSLSCGVWTFDKSMARAVGMFKFIRHSAGVTDVGNHQMLTDDECGDCRRPSSEAHFVVAG